MKIKFFLISLLICILCGISFKISAQTYDTQNVDIGYPAVDAIEKQILGQAYPNENIYKRLDRVETTVFGKISNDSLANRVDRLRDFAPTNQSNSSTTYSYGSRPYIIEQKQTYQSPQHSQNYSSYSSYSSPISSNDEYSIMLFDMEKNLLGTAYITEPVEARMARLENKVFGQSSDNYPISERMQRLTAYTDAQGSGEFFDDQQKMRKYSKVASGVKVLSVLFMILQALLL